MTCAQSLLERPRAWEPQGGGRARTEARAHHGEVRLLARGGAVEHGGHLLVALRALVEIDQRVGDRRVLAVAARDLVPGGDGVRELLELLRLYARDADQIRALLPGRRARLKKIWRRFQRKYARASATWLSYSW